MALERIGLRSHIRRLRVLIKSPDCWSLFNSGAQAEREDEGQTCRRDAGDVGRMKYQIKSFLLGAKEARRILCTTVYGRPARGAYNMGRKLSNGLIGVLKVGTG